MKLTGIGDSPNLIKEVRLFEHFSGQLLQARFENDAPVFVWTCRSIDKTDDKAFVMYGQEHSMQDSVPRTTRSHSRSTSRSPRTGRSRSRSKSPKAYDSQLRVNAKAVMETPWSREQLQCECLEALGLAIKCTFIDACPQKPARYPSAPPRIERTGQ